MVTAEENRLREELLVVRCQLGENAAFEELIRTWSPALLAHLRRVAGSQAADDLAQDVWIRMLRAIASLREGAKLKPWLFGIAHHVMMDHLRLRYAQADVQGWASDTGQEEFGEREELLSLLEARLAALPVTERETLTLFYLEDLSLAEIGRVQGVPEGTVKSRLFRARNQLRAAMPDQGEAS